MVRAYQGDTFFWGLVPQPGDKIVFSFEVNIKFKILTQLFIDIILFQPPVMLEGFKFVSGNAEHPSDRFTNTTCEILLENPKKAASLSRLPKLKDDFYSVGGFDNSGIAEGSIGPEVGKVKKFRLSINSSSENWAILSEIHIKKYVT